MYKGTLALVGILFSLVLFLAVNIVSGSVLRTWRIDLTEEHLYTLSEGSKQIARGLEEPITLKFYFSSSAVTDIPEFNDYGKRVRDILEEFARSSDGNILCEVIDPEPFSEEEDRAVQEGLYALPLNGGDSFFMGLVGFDAVDRKEKITFFDPGKERFLEYDISRLVYQLSNPERSVVGVLSHLPLGGAPGNPMLQQAGTPPWQIIAQLQSLFDARILATDLEEIPGEIDVLMVIHPRGFSPTLTYAIDQYVLGGGKALFFVDPHCEADQTDVDPSNPYASMGASKASNLEDLFRGWGVQMTSGKIVGDRSKALHVGGRGGQAEPFVVWMQVGEDEMNDVDPVTSLLQNMRFATPGNLQALPDATTEFQPLVQTTEDAMLIDVGSVQFMPRPGDLLAAYNPGNQKRTLAARISGDVKSLFADGPPPSFDALDAPDGAEEPATAEDGGESSHLAASLSPINVIVVTDVDLLDDRFWIQEEKLFGQISLGFRKTADNGDFAINAVENLAGGDELISIQARGKFSRPFERVEEIRRDAEQRHLDEQRLLEAKLQAAQDRIDQIQREKSPDTELILSPEQAAELKRAREEQLATRKKLREVKHNLRKDIEQLGTRIKWINILAVPLLLIAMALAIGLLPNLRRSS
jgi:ABC-type uncharacterized transport system involved in gliding motility auxiliary subunit